MTNDTHTEHGSAGYEKKDVNVRAVILAAAVIVVIIVASLVFVDQYVTSQNEQAVYENRLKPDNPQLLELSAHEEVELNGYKRLDSTKGWYQIPIERAMELIAQERKDNQQAPVPTETAKQ
jgi:uncharacterized membrane protein